MPRDRLTTTRVRFVPFSRLDSFISSSYVTCSLAPFERSNRFFLFFKDCPWRSVKGKVVDPRKAARLLISAEVRGMPEEMAKRYGL
jgi:hypothetical protein